MRTGYCKRHPTYQAKKPPLSDCEACRTAFEAAEANRKAFRERVETVVATFPEAKRIEIVVDNQKVVITRA